MEPINVSKYLIASNTKHEQFHLNSLAIKFIALYLNFKICGDRTIFLEDSLSRFLEPPSQISFSIPWRRQLFVLELIANKPFPNRI